MCSSDLSGIEGSDAACRIALFDRNQLPAIPVDGRHESLSFVLQGNDGFTCSPHADIEISIVMAAVRSGPHNLDLDREHNSAGRIADRGIRGTVAFGNFCIGYPAAAGTGGGGDG